MVSTTEAFHGCVRHCGGICLDDILPPDPGFKNADFYFEAENVVGELKCIEKDPLADPAFEEKLIRVHSNWVAQGLIQPPQNGRLIFDTRILPERCSLDLLALLKRKLEDSYVRGANKQIKATRARLGKPDAKGLLFLANEGNPLFSPSVMSNLLHHSFRRYHSAINQVIMFSGSLLADVPGVENSAFFWANGVIEGREPLDCQLLAKLSSTWGEYLAKTHGVDRRYSFDAESTPCEMVDGIKLNKKRH